MSQQEYPCGQCGATLAYTPGMSALHCEYCGHDTPIEQELVAIEEIDYHAMIIALESESSTFEVHTVKCTSCGAQSTYDDNIVSDLCPFCGTAIVTSGQSQKIIQPKSVLPFYIKRSEAILGFRLWIKSLWFAPSELKKKRNADERLQGIYIPHWTYDTDTVTHYTGQRGEHYWVTESYTSFENGKSVRKTRQVRKTRWWPASGVVNDHFNDVLVRASQSLPNKQADNLEPWKLHELVPYNNDYLSGFKAETYQIGLEPGFEIAKTIMSGTIDSTICRDIGGDEQRIDSKTTNYNDITFKHILLPVWISSYTYKKKVYRFLVNAQTGEVQGERPYSYWKIFFALLGGLAVIGLIYLLIMVFGQNQ
jgi:predicted RNA-binding Zn-ribbon protein involved in translation (DUF1610 family)